MTEKDFGMSVEDAQEALDDLVKLGLAVKGEDGRYRLPEGVSCFIDDSETEH